ncbi:O-antigen ligase family protein [Deefgea tanakiae]|uniref:O-antigen ligase family protein n=1 Tax=Deefgea tanakiae TaxID=2865840 RepID=A0ABX8Z6W5_9NEIS|nr:O-antigen ligase family protein [Deefgea tanakiae]QZA78313.1 O-antigen ligase family protein [Deefgea tanakiae]
MKFNYLILIFYLILAIFSVVWSILGLKNGAYVGGVLDNFKLFVVWSFIFFVIYTYIYSEIDLSFYHRVIIIAGVVIPLINFVGMADSYYAINFIPISMIESLDMRFGFHEGYIQVASHNIGSLFIIIPYLMAVLSMNDRENSNRKWSAIALILSLALAVLSGRRALWLVIAITPFVIIFLGIVTNRFVKINNKFKFVFFISLCLFGLVLVLSLFGEFSESGTLEHMKSAISAEDERSIQYQYLISKFIDYPFFGSGIGVGVNYLRSYESPWLYELTYVVMLMSLGVVGFSLFSIFFLVFIFLAIKYASSGDLHSGYAFFYLVGLLGLLIGTYSNPYLLSFDFLIYLGMLPLFAGKYTQLNMYAPRRRE